MARNTPSANPPSATREEVDPWLIVSIRSFSFEVDPGLLGRPTTTSGNKRPPILTTEIGATFLCCEATVAELLAHHLGQHASPTMPVEQLRTVEIKCSDPAVTNGDGFRGVDNGRIHRKYEAALLSCLKSKGWKENIDERKYDYDKCEESRFATAPGKNEPDIIVIRCSDLFNGNGPDAIGARAILERVCRSSKKVSHLGALHDLAVRSGSAGTVLATKCRERLRSFGGSR